MTEIEIDDTSGFCHGVVSAIRKAEEELAETGHLYCLGDIVHNNREVERLKLMGLVTIGHQGFNQLKGSKVLLRAHGEPPEVYETARKNGIQIIDATCPVVLALQRRIRQEWLEHGADTQIVIFGKRGHAEVLGLVGQTEGHAIVIENPQAMHLLDMSRNISLYSQTTKSLDEFRTIVEYIQEHIAKGATFRYYDTICRQVANRIPSIRSFAARHDRIFFVTGRKSSNGRILSQECACVNPQTIIIDSHKDIDLSMLEGARSIGITGATSTPRWLMEETADHIYRLLNGMA